MFCTLEDWRPFLPHQCSACIRSRAGGGGELDWGGGGEGGLYEWVASKGLVIVWREGVIAGGESYEQSLLEGLNGGGEGGKHSVGENYCT
jgi:hypothetical protein